MKGRNKAVEEKSARSTLKEVIFSPAQRKLTYQPNIMIFDNEQNKNVALECKKYEKYLGILTDNNLSWKHYIDHITIKISQTICLISK